MGIFYSRPALRPALTKVLRDTLEAAPGANAQQSEQIATAQADAVEKAVSGSFKWGRLALAAAVLLLIFVGYIYTAQDDKLQKMSDALLHGFEVLLGIVIGLLGGEAASRP